MLQLEYPLRFKIVKKMRQSKFIDEQHCKSHSIAVTDVILCEWHQLAFRWHFFVGSVLFFIGSVFVVFFLVAFLSAVSLLIFYVGSVLVSFFCRHRFSPTVD